MTVSRVLVANRGEIAVRVIKACRRLGVESVAAVSEVDRDSLPPQIADSSVCIGPPRSSESYLKAKTLVAAALAMKCDAIHPGYGFLSEAPELAESCLAHGITFIGPPPQNIRQMGDKLQARKIAAECGVPTVPGSDHAKNSQEAVALAENIGYPLLLKAAAGGGGRGIKLVQSAREMPSIFQTAAAEAQAAFGDSTLYMERFIGNARHIEVQILADRSRNTVHLGERDCSLQRRHQKVIEEAPATAISEELRARICTAAVTLARTIGYENAGTVEFVVDQDAAEFYFLEMNTRIQVEHPVTEMITGVDLVVQQLRIAQGLPLDFQQEDIRPRGHAIECRINAESSDHGFRPCPGHITEWAPPEGEGIRVDTHCYAGYWVPPYYDSLLAKLIVRGAHRTQAIEHTKNALGAFRVAGIDTGIPFLRSVIDDADYRAGRVNTRWLERKLEHYSRSGIQSPSTPSAQG